MRSREALRLMKGRVLCRAREPMSADTYQNILNAMRRTKLTRPAFECQSRRLYTEFEAGQHGRSPRDGRTEMEEQDSGSEQPEKRGDQLRGFLPVVGQPLSSRVTGRPHSTGKWDSELPPFDALDGLPMVDYEVSNNFAHKPALRYMVLVCGWRPGLPLGTRENCKASTCSELRALDASLRGALNVRHSCDTRGLFSANE